jgi:kynureninase
LALSVYAFYLVREVLIPLGVEIGSPEDSAERGGHVIIDHPRFQTVVERLWTKGVIPDFRAPQGLRLGLSPLSTSFGEVFAGILAIRDELTD